MIFQRNFPYASAVRYRRDGTSEMERDHNKTEKPVPFTVYREGQSRGLLVGLSDIPVMDRPDVCGRNKPYEFKYRRYQLIEGRS